MDLFKIYLKNRPNHVQEIGLCIGFTFFAMCGILGLVWLAGCFYVWAS